MVLSSLQIIEESDQTNKHLQITTNFSSSTEKV